MERKIITSKDFDGVEKDPELDEYYDVLKSIYCKAGEELVNLLDALEYSNPNSLLTKEKLIDLFGFKIDGDMHLSLALFEGYVSVRFMFNKFPLVLDTSNQRFPLYKVTTVGALRSLISLIGKDEEC